MNTLARLIKFNLDYYFKPRFDNKKERNKFIMLLVFVAVCFLVPLIVIIASVYMSASLAVANGVMPEMLSMLFMTAEIATVFFGIATYINVMYFSRDNAILMSMPIRTSHIYLSKLFVCFLSMIGISSLVVVPSVIVSAVAIYNAGLTLGAEYYIMGILSIVITPLVPLLIISILSFPVMKIVSYLKRRPVLMSVVEVLFSVSLMALIWGGMYAVESNFQGDEINVENLVAMLRTMGKVSFNNLVLSRIMLSVDTWSNIGILACILIGSIVLNIGLSLLLYRNTITRLDEGGVSKTHKEKPLKEKVKSSKNALLMREIKSVVRQPDFFIQTLLMIVLAPIMIVIFAMLDASQGQGEGTGNPELFMTGMVYFYMTITMGMNYLSAIGISREREKIGILKSLPISSKDVIRAKIAFADLASLLGCLVCSIAYVCAVKVPWYYMLFMLATGLVVSASMNTFGLLRDAKKPNLKWVNAREIVKNNFGAIIPMFITMAMGMAVMIVAGAMSALPLEHWLQELITWAIIAVLSVIYYFVFRFKKLDKIVYYFDNIEV